MSCCVFVLVERKILSHAATVGIERRFLVSPYLANFSFASFDLMSFLNTTPPHLEPRSSRIGQYHTHCTGAQCALKLSNNDTNGNPYPTRRKTIRRKKRQPVTVNQSDATVKTTATASQREEAEERVSSVPNSDYCCSCCYHYHAQHASSFLSFSSFSRRATDFGLFPGKCMVFRYANKRCFISKESKFE